MSNVPDVKSSGTGGSTKLGADDDDVGLAGDPRANWIGTGPIADSRSIEVLPCMVPPAARWCPASAALARVLARVLVPEVGTMYCVESAVRRIAGRTVPVVGAIGA